MGKLRANQQGYKRSQDKNGKTIWVPEDNQKTNNNVTSNDMKSDFNNEEIVLSEEARQLHNFVNHAIHITKSKPDIYRDDYESLKNDYQDKYDSMLRIHQSEREALEHMFTGDPDDYDKYDHYGEPYYSSWEKEEIQESKEYKKAFEELDKKQDKDKEKFKEDNKDFILIREEQEKDFKQFRENIEGLYSDDLFYDKDFLKAATDLYVEVDYSATPEKRREAQYKQSALYLLKEEFNKNTKLHIDGYHDSPNGKYFAYSLYLISNKPIDDNTNAAEKIYEIDELSKVSAESVGKDKYDFNIRLGSWELDCAVQNDNGNYTVLRRGQPIDGTQSDDPVSTLNKWITMNES